MFGEYVYEKSSAAYTNLIWIKDAERLYRIAPYNQAFTAHGFEVVKYKDDLSFRVEYEQRVKAGNDKIAVIDIGKEFVPYDIIKCFSVYEVSMQSLFPKLNSDVLRMKSRIDLDLLTNVVLQNFDDLTRAELTERFFETAVYSKENLLEFFQEKLEGVLKVADANATGCSPSYRGWYHIAEEKALIDRYSVRYGLGIDTAEINKLFQSYVLDSFGTLSTTLDGKTPVLVSRAMEYMHEHSEKFAVIVMDGMSEFDWGIISKSFAGIKYEQSAMFAMIPSTTSISRQCLLANKFPSQLKNPWVQSKEKLEFTECAKSLGYSANQIEYSRGYDADFGSAIRCGAVIINDVDDLVHGQQQGRLGMYNDISVLADERKLRQLTERLLAGGFDVYITADHGNTLCTGKGKFVGAGVDVETKSHRMAVLKDFADKAKMMEKFGLIEYPKYYLPKKYDYLICDTDSSLDNSGAQVMTHGGMTIDEVIVPFIKIKAVQNNG